MHNITIINYKPEHQPWFDFFNRQWIEADFEIEAVDEYVLSNPQDAILDKGGAILMALCDGVPAGTVGLKKIDAITFEFTKMAVGENYRRLGIGEALSYASFVKAAELGAKNILLYSNTKNAASLRLYKKLGFHHLPVEQGVYKRANVKMTISIEDAMAASTIYYANEIQRQDSRE